MMKRPSCLIQVLGAGTDEVNGIYWQTEHTLNDFPCYSKTGNFHENNEDPILIWRATDSTWYISLFNAAEGLKDSYLNYYVSSFSEDVLMTPPESSWQLFNDGDFPPPTVSLVNIPSNKSKFSLDNAQVRLLYSEKMSDVQFVCDDETVIHAHKVILSAVSPYFSTLFENPSWDEENPDGVIVTKNSSVLMKLILKFMYLGKATKKDIKISPISILLLANEYQMDKLIEAASLVAIETVNAKNIKTLLKCAEQCNLESLIQKCFEYIHGNMAEVLTDVDFITLASENLELWLKMRSFLLSHKDSAANSWVSTD